MARGFLYANLGLVDTSAVLELRREHSRYHAEANRLFAESRSLTWCVLNATCHETFTRQRYDVGLEAGLKAFRFLRNGRFRQLEFICEDELHAVELLEKFSDQELSFHDALCAAVMLCHGIYKIFTFDSDFWCFGFEVLPGMTE